MIGYLDDYLPNYEGYNATVSIFSGETTEPQHDLPFGFVQPERTPHGWWDNDGVIE